MLKAYQSAFSDLQAAFRLRHVWIALARETIGDQHRRTALGPIWMLINYLAFAGTFIFIFQRGAGVPNYEAYVATGLLIWFYIMEAVTQSVALFVREESFIKGTRLPLSVYVLRQTMQSVIRAGYAAGGCLAILLLSGIDITASWLWSGLAVLLILATTPAAVIFFAFLGAYFPDSQFILTNVMRIGMFLTPVFWAYSGGSSIRSVFYYWNPFTYFLEIVRIPILSGDLPARSFLLCLCLSLALWAVALYLLGRFRKKIVFML